MIENIKLRKDSGRPTEEIIGLVTPDMVPADELEIYCRARRDEPTGAREVMFTTDELDDDGEPTGREIWDEVENSPGQPTKTKRPGQAERWKKIMGWHPTLCRDPTPADVEEFLKAVNAEANAILWFSLKAARDAAATPPVSPTPPAATDAPDDQDRPPRPRQPPGGYKVA